MGLVSNKALYDNKLQLTQRVLRLRGQAGRHRRGGTGRGGSYPARGRPGEGVEPCVFSHALAPAGSLPIIDPSGLPW